MNTTRVMTSKHKTKHGGSRAYDYLYDPIYFVSGAKDFAQAGIDSLKETMKFQVRPVYDSMFTDLKTHPRNEMALKSLDSLPTFMDKSWEGKKRAMELHAESSKNLDINGVDRHRYSHPGPSGSMYEMSNPGQPAPEPPPLPKTVELMIKSRGTQTLFRESETQTNPWAPPYVVHGDTVPEILTLAHLSWGNGLPAGLHEVEIIERARLKRAWEDALPLTADQASTDKRRYVIETIEREEWINREEVIAEINELRLELTQKLLDEQLVMLTEKSAKRVKKHAAKVEKEKARKLATMRRDTARALRKLRFKHEGINMKYHKVDIVEEHADRRSELYGPLIRHGEHPKRGHEKLRCSMHRLDAGLAIDQKMLPGLELIRFAGPVTDNRYELCVRETHWTPEKLKALHEELKEVRLNRGLGPKPLRLLQRLPKPVPRPVTPEVEAVSNREEEEFQSSVILQKVLRGRAVQTMMCEGREKCRELIEELKSTFSLLEAGMRVLYEERLDTVTQQRFHTVELKKVGSMNEMLGTLEGSTIAQTLDFLAKELWRLQDERRAHAFALLAERERHRREAAEAGRRQLEERRRREHDEMFKQIVKVHQDTVDIYLEDLIMDSMSWVAETEARAYIQELARRVDRAAMQAHARKDCIEQEEMVADLIHNFVLPEVQKSFVRDKMKKRQQKYLDAAYDSIHERIDSITKPYISEESLNTEIGHMVDKAIDNAVEEAHQKQLEQESADSVRGLALPQILETEFGDDEKFELELDSFNMDYEFKTSDTALLDETKPDEQVVVEGTDEGLVPSIEKIGEQPTDQPVETLLEQTGEQTIEEPVVLELSSPIKKSGEQTVVFEEPTEPTDTAEAPVVESAVVTSVEKTVEQPIEEPVEPPGEKPLE